MDNFLGAAIQQMENTTDVGEKMAEQFTEIIFKGLGFDD